MRLIITCIVLVLIGLSSCSQINFDLPHGPQGEKGDKGDKGDRGVTAYEIWKENITNDKNNKYKWPKDRLALDDFMLYLKGGKGDKGDKGDKGENGLSAYQIWKDVISSGNVDNPHDSNMKWDPSKNTEADFWNFITGKNGTTPYIGANDNWFIGGEDTHKRAVPQDGISAYEQWKQEVLANHITDHKGKTWTSSETSMSDFFRYLKGQDGKDGINGINGIAPHIGNNGNWFIGEIDTNTKAQGSPGINGTNGLSAYDLWKKEVENNKIRDKAGNIWPINKNTQENFFTYLQGKDGKSAYEIWKDLAKTGNLDNPKSGTEEGGDKWPINQVSEQDFYNFLNGTNGTNGLSAYEIWKKDLEIRCGTENPLTDHNTGNIWDCNRSTLDDFYQFLSGSNGKSGSDGKPGTPGTPGTTVIIRQGIPNVIANYSQSEYGEFVRTTDGGVEYTVYDENGQKAPGAIVKGMPGIDPQKIYTANKDGQFIVPREDLPFIEDLDQRWGTVEEVTIKGEKPKQSAKNTYVPNKIFVRLAYKQVPYMYNYFTLYLNVERKTSPDSNWEIYPKYLPRQTLRYNYIIVSDKTNPQSLTSTIISSTTKSITSSGYIYNNIYRPMFNNIIEEKNSQNKISWDGTLKYFTVISQDKLYGEKLKWNGTCELPPYQLMPFIKSIIIKGYHSSSENPYFDSIEGIIDFSKIDFHWIYKSSMIKINYPNDVIVIRGAKYTKEEAISKKMIYVKSLFTSSRGKQISTSEDNPSSNNQPSFTMYTPYLNSTISVLVDHTALFRNAATGIIKKKPNTQEFYIKWANDQMPETKVTFIP